MVQDSPGVARNRAEYINISPHPLLFRGFEAGAFSLEVHKMVRKLIISSEFEPASFRVNVQDATTEVPDSVKTKLTLLS